MSTQWKNIGEIKSTQELNQILSGLDEREQFNFKIEVLAYAHNNAHSRFILWSKRKLNRYKYRKYAIKTDFIKWCKNICYFIRFYAIVMMVSEDHYNEQNNGGLIGQTTKKKERSLFFFLIYFLDFPLKLFKKYIH